MDELAPHFSRIIFSRIIERAEAKARETVSRQPVVEKLRQRPTFMDSDPAPLQGFHGLGQVYDPVLVGDMARLLRTVNESDRQAVFDAAARASSPKVCPHYTLSKVVEQYHREQQERLHHAGELELPDPNEAEPSGEDDLR